MEASAEGLVRATLHDLANVLSGVQGVLDLSPPDRPLSERDRNRLNAALAEGQMVLQRSRFLALETLPGPECEDLTAWQSRLDQQLAPLRVLFRTQVKVVLLLPEGTLLPQRLRSWIHAMCRLLLPYAAEEGMAIRVQREGSSLVLGFEPSIGIPESVDPAGPGPRDIASRWAVCLAAAMKLQLKHEGRILKATVPED